VKNVFAWIKDNLNGALKAVSRK